MHIHPYTLLLQMQNHCHINQLFLIQITDLDNSKYANTAIVEITTARIPAAIM